MNQVFDVSQYFVKQIKDKPNFKLVIDEPECTNVCFWYIPDSLLNHECAPDYKKRLHEVS